MDRKKVTLISSNGKTFEDVDLAMVVSESVIFKNVVEKGMDEGFCGIYQVIIREKVGMNEGGCGDDDDKIIFRLPKTIGKILAMVLEYCRKCTNPEDLNSWEANLAEVDDVTLSHLILAAHYLKIWELMQRAAKVMSNRNKTQIELIEYFNGKLDEEEEV